jgi:phosphoribosyl 1,2-cyclic phosphodiesterase
MSHNSKLEVRFWGVRGSLPTPGPETVLVGGNTACVEVKTPTTRIVLDAGTGLRALGDSLLASGEHLRTTILLSHVHWDHVMGLPFFSPIYIPGAEVSIASGAHGQPLRELLHRQMSAPMFPVDLESVGARVVCTDFADGQRVQTGDIVFEIAKLNHPDPVYAYRIEHAGRAIVYATDTEHYSCVDPKLARLCRGADLLIYDAQYTPEEYAGASGPPRTGWGHSTYAAGAELAEAAGVETLALFHHDPRRTDQGVAELVKRAKERFSSTVAAREGMVLGFEGVTSSRDRSAA